MTDVIFLNTRPKNNPLILDGLPNYPIKVLQLPLIDIHHYSFNDLSDDEQQMIQKLCDGFFSVVIMVSVHAVAGLVRYLQHNKKDAHFLGKITFVAVGHATKRALIDIGINAISPEDYGFFMNNEGMLKLPQIQALTNSQKVLIIKGVGGRTLLYDTLINQGIHVSQINSYQRIVPKELPKNFYAIKSAIADSLVFVLISSQFALNTWQDLAAHGRFIYLTLGDRLYQLTAQAYPNNTVILLDNLQKSHIQDAITHFLVDF